MSVIIVGAGICGLWTAQRLAAENGEDILLLEKSRGVGGRMATRRTDAAQFDHGAQFYSLRPAMQPLHERWKAAGLVEDWFENGGAMRVRAPRGLTSLAKNLAAGLNIHSLEKVSELRFVDGVWEAKTEEQKKFAADTIVLTCPLPQSLELLQRSGISFDPGLTQIEYAKALVALIEGAESPRQIQGAHGYREKIATAPEIQSIADQRAKGLSQAPAWTVTMSPEFSVRYFDEDDGAALDRVFKALQKLDRDFKSKTLQLKKWRYSHPLSHYAEPFCEIRSGLFLAGDAFSKPASRVRS